MHLEESTYPWHGYGMKSVMAEGNTKKVVQEAVGSNGTCRSLVNAASRDPTLGRLKKTERWTAGYNAFKAKYVYCVEYSKNAGPFGPPEGLRFVCPHFCSNSLFLFAGVFKIPSPATSSRSNHHFLL